MNPSHLQNRVDDLEQAIRVTGHDLQAPIRRMANLADLVLRRYPVDEPRLATLIEQIGRDATLASERVSGLMKYSRTGRTVNLERGSVQLMVDNALGITRRRLEHAGFQVTSTVDGEIEADPQLVERALIELIENALAFGATADPPRLEITVSQSASEWIIEVADNGPGVPAEARVRVFDLFGKVAREIGGVGVGLAVVRRIASLHGGTATLADAEQGTRVRFSGALGSSSTADGGA